jgi:hypothetical protein
LELLLAVCLLSVSLGPLFYLFNITKRHQPQSDMEMLGTLLAQHAMERIVAQCAAAPEMLPTMTSEEPVVASPDTPQVVSEYFRDLLNTPEGITESDSSALFWAFKPFKCQVDTYYIEDNLYKAIVYIHYEEGGQRKRVFLERLISRNQPPMPPADEDNP